MYIESIFNVYTKSEENAENDPLIWGCYRGYFNLFFTDRIVKVFTNHG